MMVDVKQQMNPILMLTEPLNPRWQQDAVLKTGNTCAYDHRMFYNMSFSCGLMCAHLNFHFISAFSCTGILKFKDGYQTPS